ncbi:MAG TPA: hypothetical protein DCE78_10245 [Bacteroidetes bacterium]|nr:hypothetical protein [Bacteroidota bacterium]
MKSTTTHIIILAIACVLILPQYSMAQYDYGFDFSKAGSAGLQFLKIAPGAREASMGEASVSVTNDVNAIFFNPAGLAYVDKPQVIVSHIRWLAGSSHNALAVAIPYRRMVYGISMVSLNIPSFEETTVFEPDGTGRMVNAGDLAIGFAVARRFTEQLVIGGHVKFVKESLDDYSITNILADIGAAYYTGFRDLRLGFSLQHFGPDMKVVNQNFRTPLIFRLGAADELIQTENYRLTMTAEIVHPTDNKEWVNTGLELKVFNSVSVRGGYRFNSDISAFSIGFGIMTPQSNFGRLSIDYAFVPTITVFESVHRFSVKFGL